MTLLDGRAWRRPPRVTSPAAARSRTRGREGGGAVERRLGPVTGGPRRAGVGVGPAAAPAKVRRPPVSPSRGPRPAPRWRLDRAPSSFKNEEGWCGPTGALLRRKSPVRPRNAKRRQSQRLGLHPRPHQRTPDPHHRPRTSGPTFPDRRARTPPIFLRRLGGLELLPQTRGETGGKGGVWAQR